MTGLHRFILARHAFSDSLSRPSRMEWRREVLMRCAPDRVRVVAVRETAVFHDKPTSGIEA